MTYTGRIRLYLIAVALLPPVLIMSVIYFYAVREADRADRRHAQDRLDTFAAFDQNNRRQLALDTDQFVASTEFLRILRLAEAARPVAQLPDLRPWGLSFAELLDSTGHVISTTRPGLLGEHMQPPTAPPPDSTPVFTNLEYDHRGPHAALVRHVPIGSFSLYTGRYLDSAIIEQMGDLLDTRVRLVIAPDTTMLQSRMKPGRLYDIAGTHQAVLSGSVADGFLLLAEFSPSSQRPVLVSLLTVTGVVALVSIGLAILLSIIITNRARREIDNLIEATDRVAEGDFSTPVMAWEQGEFSQLADSISDMMLRLTDLQKRLATTEKLAAWREVGRRLAHEIKNPLTPIAISAEDLRRSWQEGQPQFERILEETTSTIKSEVHRLSRLIDSFTRFARMPSPDLRRVSTPGLISSLEGLYRPEADSGRLQVVNACRRSHLRVDPEGILQVLVNLIKNSLESDPGAGVTVTFTDNGTNAGIVIEDTGPGFSDSRLEHPFEPFDSTKPGGSGLGLVISYRIIHDHGGEITLSNTPDHGARVQITVPQ
jgi:signal transduction histidine kinase